MIIASMKNVVQVENWRTAVNVFTRVTYKGGKQIMWEGKKAEQAWEKFRDVKLV